MNLQKISEFKMGKSIRGFFLCTYKIIKYTKNGDMFLDITLKDSSGYIKSKLWSSVDIFDSRFNRGDFVAVKGTPLEFNKYVYLSISSIKKADKSIYSEYGFDNNNFFYNNEKVNDQLWKELNIIISKINNLELKKILLNIFNTYKKNIYKLSSDYDIDGDSICFLEHVISISKIALKIRNHYIGIDMNLVITACLLSKIGLLKYRSSSSFNIENIYDDFYKINFLSWEIINSEIKKNKEFPNDLLSKLENIILNFTNYYSFEKNKIKESILCYNLCRLDENINFYNKKIVNNIFK